MRSPPLSRADVQSSPSKVTAAFALSGAEIDTSCRCTLPIVVILFNNGSVYRGDEVNESSSDPPPTVLTRGESSQQHLVHAKKETL
jgi:hypothetical protein